MDMMKRFFSKTGPALIAAVFLTGAAAVAAPDAVPAQWINAAYVKNGAVDTGNSPAQLAVRAGPGIHYSLVKTLSSGEKVTAYEHQNGWMRISASSASVALAEEMGITVSSAPSADLNPAPAPDDRKGSFPAGLLATIGVLAVLSGGGFLMYRRARKNKSEVDADRVPADKLRQPQATRPAAVITPPPIPPAAPKPELPAATVPPVVPKPAEAAPTAPGVQPKPAPSERHPEIPKADPVKAPLPPSPPAPTVPARTEKPEPVAATAVKTPPPVPAPESAPVAETPARNKSDDVMLKHLDLLKQLKSKGDQ
jgi:hypothetical protein